MDFPAKVCEPCAVASGLAEALGCELVAWGLVKPSVQGERVLLRGQAVLVSRVEWINTLCRSAS